MPKSSQESLAALRIPVSLVVQIAGKESSMLFFAQNLSMTGIYLESKTKLPADQIKVQDKMNILFYLPKPATSGPKSTDSAAETSGEMIGAKARVVRRQELQNARN